MAIDVIGTRLILIRHGERVDPPPPNNDPHLTTAGNTRAKLLARILGQASIDLIYTSVWIRTKETAQPLATQLGLTPIVKTQPIDIKNHIFAGNGGKTVLVVGHSDTVPNLIGLLGGVTPVIEDYEFDNMFMATIVASRILKVNRLKYGEKSLPPPPTH